MVLGLGIIMDVCSYCRIWLVLILEVFDSIVNANSATKDKEWLVFLHEFLQAIVLTDWLNSLALATWCWLLVHAGEDQVSLHGRLCSEGLGLLHLLLLTEGHWRRGDAHISVGGGGLHLFVCLKK